MQIVAASLGGGSFEIQQINGFEVNVSGDSYELLLINKKNQAILEDIKAILPQDIFLSQFKLLL